MLSRLPRIVAAVLMMMVVNTVNAESPKDIRADNIYAGQTSLIPDAVLAGNGDIVVTFSNHADIMPATDTLFVRSSDGGKTWSDVYLKYTTENQAENGVMVCGLFRRKDDSLLACRVEIHMPGGQLHKHQTAKIDIMESHDHGMTFEPIGTLAFKPGQLAAPYGPMIRLADDSIIMPGFIQNVGNGYWQSTDEGKTWSEMKVVWKDPPKGASEHLWFNETAYEVLKDGTILAVARNDFNKLFYSIESKDNGKTWTEPRALNVAGGSPTLHLTASGSLLLAYRDASRIGLGISESKDGGKTWRYLYRLSTPEGVPPFGDVHWDRPDDTTMWLPGEGVVGYPALIDLPDGNIYAVWHVYNRNSPPAREGRDTYGMVGNVLSNPKKSEPTNAATVFTAAQTGIILRAQKISGTAGIANLIEPFENLGFTITPIRLASQQVGNKITASGQVLLYVVGGEGTCILDGTRYEIATGDLVVIPAGTIYDLSCPGKSIEFLQFSTDE